MANQKIVYDILKGKNTLGPALDKSKKKSGDLSKSMVSLGKSFGGVALKAAGIATALGTAAAAFVTTRAVGEAVKLENALIGLQSVAAGTGQDVDFITKAAQELSKDGLIPLADSAASLKNLLASGLSAEESVKTFKVLRDSAAFGRQGALDLGEAIKGATSGIKNGNSILVDNAGITKNLSVLHKEYAESIGTTVGKLTDAQKVQAVYNGLQREGALFTGDYAKLLTTFSGSLSGVGGNFSFLLADIGSFITQSPVAIAAIAQIAGAFQSLRSFLDKNQDSIQAFVNSMIKGFVSALPTVIGFFQGVANGTSFLIGGFLRLEKGVNSLLNTFANFTLVQTIFKFLGQSIAAVTEGIVDIVSFLAGTTIGEGFLKRMGLDPQEVDTKLGSIKDKISDFAVGITGDELASITESKGTVIDQLIGANEEGIEKLNAGFEAVKNITIQNAEELDKITDDRIKKNDAKAKRVTNKEKKDVKNKYDFFKATFGEFKSFEESTNKERAANFKSTLGTISTLTSQSNSTLFAIGKAAAISTATIDGIAATQKALASAPPPINFALAALVGVASAANIAKIASAKPPQKKQDGGFVSAPTSSGDNGGAANVAANDRELFLNRSQQAELFNQARGFSGGGQPQGNQTIDIKVEVEGSQIARVIRDLQTDGFLAA